MTRNWLALASRTLRNARSASTRPGRHRPGLGLENLEGRLVLSSYATIKHLPSVVHQTSPPGVALPDRLDLNPQPLPPGFMVKVAAPDLNPQPIPPGRI
jgi:hypothetical protein